VLQDDDITKTYAEKKKEGDKILYNERAMIIETLKGGGSSNLRNVREQTAKIREKIAEEHTVYNIPDKEHSEKNSKEQ